MGSRAARSWYVVDDVADTDCRHRGLYIPRWSPLLRARHLRGPSVATAVVQTLHADRGSDRTAPTTPQRGSRGAAQGGRGSCDARCSQSFCPFRPWPWPLRRSLRRRSVPATRGAGTATPARRSASATRPDRPRPHPAASRGRFGGSGRARRLARRAPYFRGCIRSIADRSAAALTTPGGNGSTRYPLRPVKRIVKTTCPVRLSSVTHGPPPHEITQSPPASLRAPPPRRDFSTPE